MSVEDKVHIAFDALWKELRCPICLCILNDTVCVCACLHRFCQQCFEEALRKCGHHCPMCRQQIQSRRHVRKDAACDAFVKSLNLKAIQKQLEITNPHQIIPFGIKYKRELENNRERQKQLINITEDDDIDMKEQTNHNNNVDIEPYIDANEYLIRFEALNKDNESMLKWDGWYKSSELFFLVKQSVSKKLGHTDNSDAMIKLYYVYCNETQEISDTQDLTELGVIMCRFCTVKEHNEKVKLQQKALDTFGLDLNTLKDQERVFPPLVPTAIDLKEFGKSEIPDSTNSAAKPFVLLYKVKTHKDVT